jgi:hypothetical protein
MSGLLSEDVLLHIGNQSEPRREIVTRRDIRKYAIATDNRQWRRGTAALPSAFVLGCCTPE